MKSSSLKTKTPVDRVEIVIGLFCTWALEYERWKGFLKRKLGETRIGRQEITPPPERLIKVHTRDRVHAIPVDEIRALIRNGCHVCPDMTAEHSDISAGTVEGIDGWNTVVLRSERGEAFFKEAEASSVIETRLLPEGHLKHLRDASLLKKRRAIETIQEKGYSLLKGGERETAAK
jgi:coenzyme F420 hydrogenase subunit beta